MPRRTRLVPKWDISEADWIDHPPNTRFAVYDPRIQKTKADNVVFDKETGLVWERSPSKTRKVWDAAIVYSYSEAIARRKGWRLPTIEELLSLVDPTRNNPTLPLGHPFLNIQLDEFYWSSTLGMFNLPTCAWGYQFSGPNTSNVDKSKKCHVWLVRGGSGHDYPF